jgi:lysophospholipase L1-like esterase
MSDIRICFVGDSFVQGTSDPECLGWAGRVSLNAIQKGHNLTYYNLGVRRDTSRDIAERWEREVKPRLPDPSAGYVVFSFGVNDTAVEGGKARVSEELTRDIAHRILGTAKVRYQTVMIGPPPVEDPSHNSRILRLSNLLAQVAEDEGVPYLRVFERLAKDEFWMQDVKANDGSHPQSKGYQALANLVQAWSEWWFREPSP